MDGEFGQRMHLMYGEGLVDLVVAGCRRVVDGLFGTLVDRWCYERWA